MSSSCLQIYLLAIVLAVFSGEVMYVRTMFGAEANTVFTVEPTAAIAVLNTAATFTCQATEIGYSLDWYVDDIAASHREVLDRGIAFHTIWDSGPPRSVLTVDAVLRNNETRVRCEAFSYRDGGQLSPEVTLIIQGVLAAPGNLSAELQNGDFIILYWNLPFTLLGVHITSIKLYFRKASNYDVVTLPGNSTTHYFKPNGSDPDPCDTYTFHITAINEAGESEHSNVIQESFLADPIQVKREDVEVTVQLSTEQITLTFRFSSQEVFCPGKAAEQFIVNMTCDSITFVEPRPATMKQNNHTVVKVKTNIHSLPLNTLYNATITAMNDVGSVESNGTISASTFDVQDAQLVKREGDQYCLYCQFANGSKALGCVAVVEDSDVTITAMRNPDIEDSNASKCVSLKINGGYYDVLVYDLEADETRSDFPALRISLGVPESETKQKSKFSLESTKGILVVSTGAFIVCVVFVIIAAVVVAVRFKRKRKGKVHHVYDTVQWPRAATGTLKSKNDASNIPVSACLAYEYTGSHL